MNKIIQLLLLAVLFVGLTYYITYTTDFKLKELSVEDSHNFCLSKGFDNDMSFHTMSDKCNSDDSRRYQWFPQYGLCCAEDITVGDKVCEYVPSGIKVITDLVPPFNFFGGVC